MRQIIKKTLKIIGITLLSFVLFVVYCIRLLPHHDW